jgi:hypothetical protein
MARQRALHLDPQQALGRGAAEGAVGVLDVVEDAQAAPVIGLAVERGPHHPGGALQQARAQPVFQLADHLGAGGAGHLHVVRGLGEAAPLDYPDVEPHRVESVHSCAPLFA